MSGFNLTMYEENYLPTADAVFLPALNRALYIVDGAITVESPDAAQFQPAGTAWLGHGEATVLAGKTGARVWRWELEKQDGNEKQETKANDGRVVRSSPAVQSQLKLRCPIELDDAFDWLIRCDSVSFPPGGIAYTHVHQGPGIRCVVAGDFRIETEGAVHRYAPDDAWLESGHSPVTAYSSEQTPSWFVRCFILPSSCKGRSSVRYVNRDDWAKPKPQTYHIFGEKRMRLAHP